MAWTFIASTHGHDASDGTILDVENTLNIAAGDMIVGAAAYESATVKSLSIATTTPDNYLTMCAGIYQWDDMGMAVGYRLVTTARNPATFRMTPSSNCTTRHIVILQFRPDAGDVISLAASESSGFAVSTAIQSGNISPSGTDLMVVGAAYTYSFDTWSNRQIGDVVATGFETSDKLSLWYKAYTSSQSGIHAQATIDNDNWLADVLAIESAIGVSDPITWTPHVHKTMVFA